MAVGDIKSRSDWGARAPEGTRRLVSSEVRGIANHYNGPPVGASAARGEPAGVASYLRNTQRFHMDERGWSDIAYQVAVDAQGTIWTLRGLNIRSGANGCDAVNDDYGAILYVIGTGQVPTDEMIAGGRYAISLFRRIYPHATLIRGHMDVKPICGAGGTDCPGPIQPYVRNGALNPSNPPEDEVTPEDRKLIVDGVVNALAANQGGVLDKIGTEVIRTVINASGTPLNLAIQEMPRNTVDLLLAEGLGASNTPSVALGIQTAARYAARELGETLPPAGN